MENIHQIFQNINNNESYKPIIHTVISPDEVPQEVKDNAKKNHIEYLREKRNKILANTDKYFLPDYPGIDDNKIRELKIYRQQLRDYMSHSSINEFDGFNVNTIIQFPIKPLFVKDIE